MVGCLRETRNGHVIPEGGSSFCLNLAWGGRVLGVVGVL